DSGGLVLVVPRPQLGPLLRAELAARGGDLGQLDEVRLAWSARREQDQHRGRRAGRVGEAVNATRRHVEVVAGRGVAPRGAVVEGDRPAEDEEGFGDRAVIVPGRHGAGRWYGRQVPPVQAELALGGGSGGQVADLGPHADGQIRRRVARAERGAGG